MPQTPEGLRNGLRATRRPTFGQAILITLIIWPLLLLKFIGGVAACYYNQTVYYLEAYLNVLEIQESYREYRERPAADPDWDRREEEERAERRRRAAERRGENKQKILAAKRKAVESQAEERKIVYNSEITGVLTIPQDSPNQDDGLMENGSGTEDQVETLEQNNQLPKSELSSRQLNIKDVVKTQSVPSSDGKEKPVEPLAENSQRLDDNAAKDPDENPEMAESSTTNAMNKELLETPNDEFPEAVIGQDENKPQDLPETGDLASNVGPTPGPTISESQPHGINSPDNTFQPAESEFPIGSEKKGIKPDNKSDDANIIISERPGSMIEQAATSQDNMVPKVEPVDTSDFPANLSDTAINANEVLGSNTVTKAEENEEDKDKSESKKDVEIEDMVETNTMDTEDVSSSENGYSDDSSDEEEDSHDKKETNGDNNEDGDDNDDRFDNSNDDDDNSGDSEDFEGQSKDYGANDDNENGNWGEDSDMDGGDSKTGSARHVSDASSQTLEPETGSGADRLRFLGVDETDVQSVAGSEATGLTRPNSSPSKEVINVKEKSAARVIPVTPDNEIKRPNPQLSPSSPVLSSIERNPLPVREGSQPQDPNSYNLLLRLEEINTAGSDADAKNNTFMDSRLVDDANNQADPSSQNTSIAQAIDPTTKLNIPLVLNIPQPFPNTSQHPTPQLEAPGVLAQTQVPALHQKQFAVKKHVTFAEPKVSLKVDEKSLLAPAEKIQNDVDDGGGDEERVPIDAPGSGKRPAGGLASDSTAAGVDVNIDSHVPETQLLAAKTSDAPTMELTTTDMRIPGALNLKSDSALVGSLSTPRPKISKSDTDSDLSAETTDSKYMADVCTWKDAQEHKETSGGQEDGDKPAATTPQLALDTTSAVPSVTRGDRQEEPAGKDNDAFDDNDIPSLYEENSEQDDFKTCLPDTDADEDTKASSSSFPNGDSNGGEVNTNTNDAEHNDVANGNPDGNLHVPRVRSQSFTTMLEGIGQQKAFPTHPMQSQRSRSMIGRLGNTNFVGLECSQLGRAGIVSPELGQSQIVNAQLAKKSEPEPNQKPESSNDEPETSTRSPEVTTDCPGNLPRSSGSLLLENPETSEKAEGDKPAESTPLNQPIPKNDTAKDIQKSEEQTTVCQDFVHNSEPITKETTTSAQIQTQIEEANLSPTPCVLVKLDPSRLCTTIPIMNARTLTSHVPVHITPDTNTIWFRAPLFNSTCNIPSQPTQGWRTHIIRPENSKDLAAPDIHIQYGSALGYIVINEQKQKVRREYQISKRKIGGDEEKSPVTRREEIGKAVPSVEGAVMGKEKEKEGERKRGERKHRKRRRDRAEEKETDNDKYWSPKVNKDETWWEKGAKNQQDIPSQAAMGRKEREWKERREERRKERRGYSAEKIVHKNKEKEAAEERRRRREGRRREKEEKRRKVEVQRGGTQDAGGHPENSRELAISDEDLDRLMTGQLPRKPERRRGVGKER